MPDRYATSFSLGGRGERFLFFDAFIVEGSLVFVSTYYPDVVFDFNEVEVTLDGRTLTRFEEVGRNEHEPTRAVVYPVSACAPGSAHTLVVSYRTETLSRTITVDAPDTRRRFSLATLFKDDWCNLEPFVRYYREQGVERFYLFYNGALPAVRSGLPAGPDLVYGEWNFPYWLDRKSRAFHTDLVDPTAQKNFHHAQTAFLTLVRHRYLAGSSFLGLVDLDEFLFVRGTTLREHLERTNPVSLTARSHWTEVRPLEGWVPNQLWQKRAFRIALALPQRIRRTLQLRIQGGGQAPTLLYSDLARLWANVRSEGDGRTKTIYRHDYNGLFGIHRPKPPAPVHYSDELKLYHLVNTVHARHTRIHADAEPLSLLAGGA